MTTIHAATTASSTVSSREGCRLAVGAALLAAGVALEWVLNPQQGDGTVDRPVYFALCAGTSLLGAGLLAVALRRLRRALPRTRPIRFGGATSVAGVVLLVVALAGILGSGLATGTPAVVSFIPWALGVLALTIGPLVLGVGLLRQAPALAVLCLVAGIAAFASVAIPLDPWHDVALMTLCACWVGVGLVSAQAVASTRSRL